jgi:hypothetical protein
MSQLSTHFHCSLMFHPQADRCSERTNKTVVGLLVGQIIIFGLAGVSQLME